MRRTLSRSLRFEMVGFAFLLLCTTLAIADDREFNPSQYPPPGKLVDIGGWRLHLHCTGADGPAVVFLSGAGDFSFDWSLVQPAVADFALACSYDRAGSAWSDPGPIPRTMRQEAYELHSLLQKAGVDRPYVLVGHSYGGLLVRRFAESYPDEVAGMVLVDPTHEDTVLMVNSKLVRMREMANKDMPVPAVQTKLASPPRSPSPKELQEFRDFQKFIKADQIQSPFDRLPAPVQSVRLWALSRPLVPEGQGYMAEEMAEMHAGQRVTEHSLGDKPVEIIIPTKRVETPPGISADEWAKLNEEKVRQKESLGRLSRNSKVVVAPRSGHHVMLDEPAVVVQAVREVVEAARGHSRLGLPSKTGRPEGQDRPGKGAANSSPVQSQPRRTN
jgi:pimeloyl-ACP methyl ester carboxylesterase